LKTGPDECDIYRHGGKLVRSFDNASSKKNVPPSYWQVNSLKEITKIFDDVSDSSPKNLLLETKIVRKLLGEPQIPETVL